MAQEKYVAKYTKPSIEEAIAFTDGKVKGVHKACASVPEISVQDFDRLVESIATHELVDPIELDTDHKVIDGRSRLQAFAALGKKLLDNHIISTTTDPWVVASTNYARRHLTDDQMAMEAVPLLDEERKRAAERKAQGAENGRVAKKRSHGTKLVPSDEKPKERQPRATDMVSASTGVSREKLTDAKKLSESSPDLAAQVKQGHISLKAALKQAGLTRKRKNEPSQVESASAPRVATLTPSVTPTGSHEVWKDDNLELIDLPTGVRRLRSPMGTFFTHKTKSLVGVVLQSADGWFHSTGSTETSDTSTTREKAEAIVLKYFKAKN